MLGSKLKDGSSIWFCLLLLNFKQLSVGHDLKNFCMRPRTSYEWYERLFPMNGMNVYSSINVPFKLHVPLDLNNCSSTFTFDFKHE